MKVIGIIPARMNSSRFPGKPMASILGLPMVEHCYQRARLVSKFETICVATCDEVIFDHISSIGGISVMTSPKHDRATTRTAEALEIIEARLGVKFDLIVMIQGDEPLIAPEAIEDIFSHFEDPEIAIVNIMSKFHTLEAFEDKNNVKVVVDRYSNALYFSREPIPSPWKGWDDFPRFMQTGIIAFRRDALVGFNKMQESGLEKIESIDMNRVLEAGIKIRMVRTDFFTLGIDTAEELVLAEKYLINDSSLHRYMKN